MQRLRSRLPPVNALVVFEAAARHLSFTNAAAELGVTREAVSRQISGLERHLGCDLFVRQHRAVILTPAGERFSTTVHEALERIASSAHAISPQAHERVTLTATIAIASYWLTPRLPKYRRLSPRTEIRVVVSDPYLDLHGNGIDLGLRYGDGAWPGCESIHLFGVSSGPVCSPAYIENNKPLKKPQHLLGHTLLNLDGAIHAEEDWAWWLQGIGLPSEALGRLDIVGFDNYANVIQAAIDGQGVALGFSGIVDTLIEQNRLVRPIKNMLDPGHSVYLLRPATKPLSSNARSFYDWVLSEAQT